MAIASPPPMNGKTVVLFHLVVFGNLERAKSVQEFLTKEIGTAPMAEFLPLDERPWPVINASVDFIWPYGKPVYTKGVEISGDDEEALVSFVNTFLAKRSTNVNLGFDWCYGEYCNKSGTEAGFHHHGKRCSTIFGVVMVDLDPTKDPVKSKEEAKRFFSDFLESTKNVQRPAKYVNFNEENSLSYRTSKELHDRFMKVKAQVDPEGFFGGGNP
jgi:hypothetical protein